MMKTITTKEETLLHLKELEKEIDGLKEQLKEDADNIEKLTKANYSLGKRPAGDELKTAEETVRLLELQLRGFTKLRDAIRELFDGLMPQFIPEGENRMRLVQSPLDLKILKGEGGVAITTVPTQPKEFSTDNEKGRIVCILAEDLRGKPSPKRDFTTHAREEGWVDLPNFEKRMNELIMEGVIVTENSEKDKLYRFAGKIKVLVDGKEPEKK